MKNLSQMIDWDNANIFDKKSKKFIIVPLKNDNISLLKNYKFKRLILFYKENNNMTLEVVEFLGHDNLNSLNIEKIGEIIDNRLRNKINYYFSEINNLKIYFYNQFYSPIAAYKIENNIWGNETHKFSNKLNLNNTIPNRSVINGNNENCTLWGTFLINYDEDGNIVSEELLYSYYICNNDFDGAENTSGGGGAPGSPDEECYDDECMYDLEAENVLTAKVSSYTSSPQESNINFSSSTSTVIPFEWTVVQNSHGLWKVTAKGEVEGYYLNNGGGIIYRITHLGSSMPPYPVYHIFKTNFRNPTNVKVMPIFTIKWSETSHNTSISSDYKTGYVYVSGSVIFDGTNQFKNISNNLKIKIH